MNIFPYLCFNNLHFLHQGVTGMDGQPGPKGNIVSEAQAAKATDTFTAIFNKKRPCEAFTCSITDSHKPTLHNRAAQFQLNFHKAPGCNERISDGSSSSALLGISQQGGDGRSTTFPDSYSQITSQPSVPPQGEGF